MTSQPVVFVTSGGRYLTRWQLHRRLGTGRWTRRLVDRSTGTLFVETARGAVIVLTRLPTVELPDWLEIQSDGERNWVADRRRTLPPCRTVARTLEEWKSNPAGAQASPTSS